MSAIQLTPYQAEQKKIAIAKGVILGVALAVLATFAALHRDSLFMFMKEHTTFSMYLLPAAVAGLLMGPALNELKKKKQIVLALTVALAALAVLAHYVLGHTLVQNTTLAFGGGLLTYFMFNSKEKDPEIDANGLPLMSPNVDFAYGDVAGEWKEVNWEGEEVYINLDLAGRELPAAGTIIARSKKVLGGEVKFYYRVKGFEDGFVTGYPQYKGFYSPSQKRVDEKGNTFYPIYLYEPIGKKQKFAAWTWIGILGRGGFGIAFNLLIRPLYAIFLALRLMFYDIWVSENRSELLGNRFFEILNVFGESLEGVGKNALCAVAGTIVCWSMGFEGFKHGRPMNAQKALAKIEQIQNKVGVHQSFWSLDGRQFHFKGFSEDLKMHKGQEMRVGEQGFYVLGCCQPFDLLQVNSDGEMSIKNISKPQKEASKPIVNNYDLSSDEDWSPDIPLYPSLYKKS